TDQEGPGHLDAGGSEEDADVSYLEHGLVQDDRSARDLELAAYAPEGVAARAHVEVLVGLEAGAGEGWVRRPPDPGGGVEVVAGATVGSPPRRSRCRAGARAAPASASCPRSTPTRLARLARPRPRGLGRSRGPAPSTPRRP